MSRIGLPLSNQTFWPASAAIVLALTVCQATSSAQSSPNRVDPRFFGFDIPPGEIRAGDGRRVTTTDFDGNPVVAKVHVEVGQTRIVLLPDGQLVARTQTDSPLTERKFEEASKDELAKRLTAATFKDFKTNASRHYLYVYNTSEGFALVTSRIMESMFRGVELHAKAQKIGVRTPDVPMVVIMFATEEEFQRYRKMPPGVVAYYDPVSNRVVMYEESKLAAIKPELAIQQSISVIAHEGAHQILHNIGVQKRLSVWPMWLAEGLAEYFAPTSTDERMNWKGAGQINDLRMSELEEYLKLQASDGADGKTVEATVAAARLTSTGYASAWSLTHYLAKNERASFNEYVLAMSKLGPLEGILQPTTANGGIQENLDVFQQHFGDDLAAIEKRLVLHLRKQRYTPPFADWPHYVALIWYPGGKNGCRKGNLFRSASLRDQWQREALASLTEEQRGGAKVTLQEFPNRSTASAFVAQWNSGR